MNNELVDLEKFNAFLKDAKRDSRNSIQGFRFSIISPAKYRHKSITFGFDGMLASGDPYFAFYWHHRYKMRISEAVIGDETFAELY